MWMDGEGGRPGVNTDLVVADGSDFAPGPPAQQHASLEARLPWASSYWPNDLNLHRYIPRRSVGNWCMVPVLSIVLFCDGNQCMVDPE